MDALRLWTSLPNLSFLTLWLSLSQNSSLVFYTGSPWIAFHAMLYFPLSEGDLWGVYSPLLTAAAVAHPVLTDMLTSLPLILASLLCTRHFN